MSTAAIIAIAIGVVVVLGAVSFFTLARRSDVRGAGALSGETVQKDKAGRKSAEPVATQTTASDVEAAGQAARTTTTTAVAVRADTEVVTWTPPDPDVIGVSRRQFFNRATVSLMSVSLAGFGGSVTVGKLATIKDGIKQGGGFFYAAEARSWITEYPAEALPLAETVYPESVLSVLREGIVVLSQKCPHLGCRVPNCATSQWFECQCHGSQYNRAGEKKAGPAPRGMDRHPATIAANGDVTVDTGTKIPGPAIGVNTTGQEAEGPHCTGGGH